MRFKVYNCTKNYLEDNYNCENPDYYFEVATLEDLKAKFDCSGYYLLIDFERNTIVCYDTELSEN